MEWVGTVVMVALLAGAMALWAAREMRPPERPPDPVAAVVRPLDDAGGAAAHAGGLVPPQTRALADRARRAVWSLGRGARDAIGVGTDMGAAFGTGFAGKLRGRLRDIIDNPPTGADLVPDPAALVPGAVVREVVGAVMRDPGAVVDYVRMLRGLPPREAAVRAAGDAGEATAVVAMEAAEFLVKRLILRGLVRIGGGGRSGTGVP